MDTEKQLMEQLHQLKEENQALINGHKIVVKHWKAKNEELVDFIKDVLKDMFDGEIERVDFEKDRLKRVNDAISSAYKTFSKQVHEFGEIAENLREDKSPEVTRLVWSKVKEFVSMQSKEATKKGQQTTASGVKEADKQKKDVEKRYKELSEKFENIRT